MTIPVVTETFKDDVMTWLGRGPQENYADRKTGYPIGLYTATVWEQFHP